MNSFDKFTPIEQNPSASERVAQRLRDLITSGNIAPGDKLPSENELARALHVSRPVVREALRGLAMMGIVQSKHGGGCFVTDLSPNRLMAPLSFVLSLQDYTIESLFKARLVIDTGIAVDAALYASDDQISALKDLVHTGNQLVDDPVAFRVMDVEFHELIATCAKNDFLEKVSSALYGLAMEERRKASEQPGVLRRSAVDHDNIVTAIAAHDSDAAREAMATHVSNIRDSTMALLKLRRGSTVSE